MSRVLTLAWWRSIAGALLRTGLAALVPFIPALVANPAATWQVAFLTVALVLVLAVANALGSLPDLTTASWWEVAVQRSLRQFGQMVAAAAASAALLTDVNWRVILIAAAGSALSTLVIAAIASLPSAPSPAALSGVTVNGTVSVAGPGMAHLSNVTITGNAPSVPDLGKPRHAGS